MHIEKSDFISLILEAKVLTWGEFTLKSGRVSPYFFNAGSLCDGNIIRRIGEFYAKTLLKHEPTCHHLFGPAYKGIPLATATAIACAANGHPIDFTFNRKEAKTHGEGGCLIGAPLKNKRVVMIDDVITAGTAFRESQALIAAENAQLTGVIIALDRQERGPTGRATLTEIKDQGVNVYSIITLSDLIEYTKQKSISTQFERLENYRKQYGAT